MDNDHNVFLQDLETIRSMKCKTSNCNNLMGSANGFCGACNSTPVKPSHYQGNGMQAVDVIEAFKLGYNLGNVVKYVLRAGKKDDRNQDLDKAIAYLWRERYGTWRP